LYAELFVEAGLKRAISRSDVLYKEIYDRLEGKAPQELRFAGYAEPYSEERMKACCSGQHGPRLAHIHD
jgi:hypothetical protein